MVPRIYCKIFERKCQETDVCYSFAENISYLCNTLKHYDYETFYFMFIALLNYWN